MFSLRRTVSVAVLVLAAGLAHPVHADQLRGVALVIGQADYEALTDLGNPLNDARAMDDMLSELGFDVTRVLDRGGERLRREVDDFLDDAEGADVAIVYYAGHAVEAGGQNYLVPIDADLSTPTSAGASLVPVGELLDELAREVPVTILLLDACRTSAFPDGTEILLPGRDEPVQIAATGLGEMRGPTPVVANIDPESLGMVIGFASAPGEAALDGPAGTNSPYAAALLKHLGAGGYAFGDLMTMVAEEVYLKTGARQIPWMNSSLRRVLSFEAVEPSVGDEALIRDGRRKLLLSIAATPSDVRRQVETAATEAAVPMDTLYGLLEAMGTDVPSDPAALDQLLQTQTETLHKVMAERRTLTSADPEIVRLSDLAQRALDEGALPVSLAFWEQAKARYQEIGASLDTTEDQLRQRRLEGGALLASAARTYSLSGDYAASAENFRLAFAEVERWDDALALDYRHGEANATYELGVRRGDSAIMRDAIDLYQDALGRAPTGTPIWAMLQREIGNSYGQLGMRDATAASIDASIAAFEASLGVFTRDTNPNEWAKSQTRLAAALSMRADREPGTATINATIDAYHRALEVLSAKDDPVEWSLAQNNLGLSLKSLGEREAGVTHYTAAIEAFRAALSVQSPETNPTDWSVSQNNLGAVQVLLGMRQLDDARLNEAVETLRGTLAVLSRDRVPLQWAQAYGNLGAALLWLGTNATDNSQLEQAAAAFRATLEEVTPERALPDWVTAMTNLGNALTQLGRRGDHDSLLAGVEAYRSVIAALPRDSSPLQWALAQNNLGATLNLAGEIENDPARFEEARAALELALQTNTRELVPLDWAMTQQNLGNVLANIGLREAGTETLLAAVAAYRSALLEYTQERGAQRWAELQRKVGNGLAEVGQREPTGVDRFSEALDAYSAAASVFTPESDPLEWATTANSAAWAMAEAGYRMNDVETVREARTLIQTAWDTVRAEGLAEHDDYFAERLKLIDEVLASYQPSPSDHPTVAP